MNRMKLIRVFKARRKLSELIDSLRRNSRRPFSFGVPASWYRKTENQIVRLARVLDY